MCLIVSINRRTVFRFSRLHVVFLVQGALLPPFGLEWPYFAPVSVKLSYYYQPDHSHFRSMQDQQHVIIRGYCQDQAISSISTFHDPGWCRTGAGRQQWFPLLVVDNLQFLQDISDSSIMQVLQIPPAWSMKGKQRYHLDMLKVANSYPPTRGLMAVILWLYRPLHMVTITKKAITCRQWPAVSVMQMSGSHCEQIICWDGNWPRASCSILRRHILGLITFHLAHRLAMATDGGGS